MYRDVDGYILTNCSRQNLESIATVHDHTEFNKNAQQSQRIQDLFDHSHAQQATPGDMKSHFSIRKPNRLSVGKEGRRKSRNIEHEKALK